MIGVTTDPQLPPIKIAFIIDNKVEEMLYTDERLAALFLSQPTIIDVTNIYDGNSMIGMTYNPDTGEFSSVL